MVIRHLENDDWGLITRDLLREGANIKIKTSLEIKDFMRPNPWIVTEDSTLRAVGDIMINKKIDGVPIVDDEGKLIGLVSKTLLLTEVLKGTALDRPVKDIMITDVIATGPKDDVSKLITVNIANLPVVNAYDKVLGIVTLSDTIRAYFSSLIAVREQLHTIIDSAHNGILTVNDEGNIVMVNSAVEEFFSLNWNDIIGRQISDILPDSQLLDVLETGQVYLGKKLVYGDRIFISNHSPVISNGEVIGAVAVFQDISNFEMISEELHYTKQMKEELDAIIESSFDGIYVTDGAGKNLRVNESYCRISGIARDYLLGKTGHEIADEGLIQESVSAMVLERRELVTMSQETNSGHTVIVTGNPIFDEEGNIFRVVMNIRDMSEIDQLKSDLEKALNLSQHYQEKLNKYRLVDQYVIRSQKSRDLVDLCIRLGQVDATVLVQGESGVGKEVFANIIHCNSSRSNKPIISINCAAIPENLLESELFGYSPGAFTGAHKNGKPGIFETAHEGTLFLDEIAELPLALQSKLLRAIQQKEITRVGSTKPTSIDVRIIAATNRDLEEMVKLKEFRQDLYYRLNVVPVIVPSLRERKMEIPFLVAHFVKVFNEKYGLNKHMDERTIRELMQYEWPGNIRELENMIERLLITTSGDTIYSIDLPCSINSRKESNTLELLNGYKLKPAIENLEKQLIKNALDTFGSTRKVASELGVSQPTIVRKAAKYKIALRDID